MRSEWRHAPDFHEVAETLGVKTTQVVSAMVLMKGAMTVIYSPAEDDPTEVSMVILKRDDDGVFQVASDPQEMPGFFDQLKARIDQDMRKELGEP